MREPSRRKVVLCYLAVATTSAATTTNASRRIQERFIAPCCWTENLAVHRSPAAEEMRAEVDRLVASGKTETEIVDIYVARYGEKVLREPRGKRFTWLLATPIGAAAIGLVSLVAYVRRIRRLPEQISAGVIAPVYDRDLK